MSKIPVWRLLAELPARQAKLAEKRAKKEGVLWENNSTTFTRTPLNQEKKSEIIKLLQVTQENVKKILVKLNEWPLEKGERNSVYLSGWSHSSYSEPKHSNYRAWVIRKIKKQIIEWYTAVREILDLSSGISHSENLRLLWEIDVFDETFSTTLTAEEVQKFQKSIFNILKPILVDLKVIK